MQELFYQLFGRCLNNSKNGVIEMEAFSISYVYTVIFMMLISNILVYVLSRTPGFGRSERWIIRLLIAVCICDLSDALEMALRHSASETALFILDVVFFFSVAFISLFLLCYSENMYGSEMFKNRLLLILIHVPIDILCVLLIFSYWTGWIYRFPQILILSNIYNVVSIALSIWRLGKERDEEKRKLLWQSILYITPFFIGIFLQCFINTLPWATSALTITILLIFINNQERLLRKKTQDAEAAVRAKSEFLSHMSHDIRTPINGIMGMLDIAQAHLENPEKMDSCLSKMRGAADQLLSLINDVLDMSKIETGSILLVEEPFDMMRLLNGTLAIQEIIASEKGLTIEQNIEGNIEHPYVCGSPNYVRSILVNIVSNAIKYTNPGGQIFVSAREISCDDEYVEYEFIISDTGIGMSEEFAEHIFEPFTQEHAENRSSYRGTGLGMSIVKNLINKMKGTITLQTMQGKGTTFTITLPVKLDTVCLEETDEEETSIEGMKILLVEDNELNLEVAQYILVDAGAEIVVARDGLESIELFEQSESNSFDAILMDVMMPVMDGLTATKKIRKLKRKDAKTVPIIAMTANVFNEDIIAAKEAGMNEHIAKPLDFDKLIHTLAKNFSRAEKN